MIFYDRKEAGCKLSQALQEFQKNKECLVIALPRGGVVVGYEVAHFLQLPLDIVCPRKIGAPGNPEYAIGAITETGDAILSQETIAELGIPLAFVDQAMEKEKEEAKRRLDYFRKGLPPRQLKEKIIILVDDGIATGSTMRAAIKMLKSEGVKKIILAIPVAPPETLHRLEKEVDLVVCLSAPPSFYAVGQFYTRFDQTSDEEVVLLLEKQGTLTNQETVAKLRP